VRTKSDHLGRTSGASLVNREIRLVWQSWQSLNNGYCVGCYPNFLLISQYSIEPGDNRGN